MPVLPRQCSLSTKQCSHPLKSSFMSPTTPPSLLAQALQIVQNLLADATPLEISKTVDQLGDVTLLDLLAVHASAQSAEEVRVPVSGWYRNVLTGVRRSMSCQISH